MRVIAILVAAGLMVAVVAEGAVLLKTQKQLDAVTEKLAAMEEQAAADEEYTYERELTRRQGPRGAGDPIGDQLPPAEFLGAMQALGQAVQQAGGLDGVAAAATADLPLPPALSSPEARAQLGDFVAAQVAKIQEQQTEQQSEKRTIQQEDRRTQWADKLGLSGEKNQEFQSIVGQFQTKLGETFAQVRQGDMQWNEARHQMRTLRGESAASLRELLGDDQFREFMRMSGGMDVPGGGRRGGRDAPQETGP